MERTIWLIEPSRLFRDALRRVLNEGGFKVVLEASSLEVLTPPDVKEVQPDLILVHLQAPLLFAESEQVALSKLCSRLSGSPVITLADELSLDQLVAVFRAGARGYLTGDIAPATLRESLLLACAGESLLPSGLVPLLTRDEREPGKNRKGDLSAGEEKVLSRIALGESNKALAKHLAVSEGTVKVHVKSVFRKIGARNRTEAAVWARGGDTTRV